MKVYDRYLVNKEKLNDYKLELNIKKTKIDSIYNGGMPELYHIKDMNRNIFFSSYINTYIERDVRKLINVVNIETFKKFMRDIAIRNGKL